MDADKTKGETEMTTLTVAALALTLACHWMRDESLDRWFRTP